MTIDRICYYCTHKYHKWTSTNLLLMCMYDANNPVEVEFGDSCEHWKCVYNEHNVNED